MTLLLESPSFGLHWSPRPGTFYFESPGRSLRGKVGVDVVRGSDHMRVTTSEVRPVSVDQSEVRDVHGTAQELRIQYNEVRGLLLSVQLRLYASRPFALMRAELLNKGPKTAHLQRFFFRTLPHELRPAGDPVGFYGNGWQSWSPAGFRSVDQRDFTTALPLRPFVGPLMHNGRLPWSRGVGRYWAESVGALVTQREALVVGGASLADQFVQVCADLRPKQRTLMLQSQGDNVPLHPGEARVSEWFYLEWVPLPNRDPLAQYAYTVARQMSVPQPREVPTGWSSWYIFWDKVAETDVKDNLAEAARLADELPLDVIQLDQGFEPLWGDWTARNERFPHSLDWLADRVAGSGFRPGLWLGPLTVHPKSALATQHPEWLLRNQRGRPVSAGFLAYRFFARALDPTHPGVEEYLRRLIRRVVHEWGYRYLKLDFMYAGALPAVRHNPQLTRAQAYRNALRIIREAAGEETYLVGCGAPLGPSVGLVDAMRIGPDTAPRWLPHITGLDGLFRGDPSLPALRNSLRNIATRAWMHGRWWVNDPDNLMVRAQNTHLTMEEIQAQATFQGLSGGVLMLSDDLPELREEQREIAAALLPPLVGGMDTMDLFQSELPAVVCAPVAQPWESWQLVGLFNWSEREEERALPRDLPHFDLNRDYHIVDFWNRSYQRLEKGMALPNYVLPPHGCVLLSVRQVREGPQLVATTFHIAQGGEVQTWEADAHELTLSLALDRIAEGEIWLDLPTAPKEAFLDGTLLPDSAVRAVAPGVWAVRFRLDGSGRLQVRF